MTETVDTLDQYTLIKIVAFILLGSSGTLLLLPHHHGLVKAANAHRVGYALVGIAVILFASFWTAPRELITRFFFYAFGLAAVLGAILTVTNRNPIYSALWFASVVLSTSGLFLLSGAQFLAAGTIIVYAGAIIVTFLFVIMLAQMEGRAIYDRTARSPFWATLSSYLLLFGLCYALFTLPGLSKQTIASNGQRLRFAPSSQLIPAVQRLTDPSALSDEQRNVFNRSMRTTAILPEAVTAVQLTDNKMIQSNAIAPTQLAGTHVAGLGAALYTDHLVTVELAGALLFVALIGALSIAAPRPPIRPATHDAVISAGK